MNTTVVTDSAAAGQRLDLFCAAIGRLTRSRVQRAIRAGQIRVNGHPKKPRYLIKTGDVVTLPLPPAAASVPVAWPPAAALPIIYEDADVVVIDKPAKVAVHPGAGPARATVAQWFADRYPQSRAVGEDPARPGVVHRLDRDTSGVLVLAKTPEAYVALKRQFRGRQAKKEYLALVFGVPSMKAGRIHQPLARSPRHPLRRTVVPTGRRRGRAAALRGKDAITEWRLEEALGKKFALLTLWPLTGRTHQLRAHLHFLGYPIVGDALYTFKRQRPPHGVRRQLLHAAQLTIRLPKGGRRTFHAPLPEDFAKVLDEIRSSHGIR